VYTTNKHTRDKEKKVTMNNQGNNKSEQNIVGAGLAIGVGLGLIFGGAIGNVGAGLGHRYRRRHWLCNRTVKEERVGISAMIVYQALLTDRADC
jgi:hypothetical protein